VAYHLAALDGVPGPAEADGRLSREGEYRRMMTEAVDKFLRSLVKERIQRQGSAQCGKRVEDRHPVVVGAVRRPGDPASGYFVAARVDRLPQGGDRKQWVRYFNSLGWADGD
jgi:hypothetical protein